MNAAKAKLVPHDDEMLSGLQAAAGQRVEIIAFGIAYTGMLEEVNIAAGFATVVDGDNKACLECERIESFRLLPKV